MKFATVALSLASTAAALAQAADHRELNVYEVDCEEPTPAPVEVAEDVYELDCPEPVVYR